MRSNLPVAIFSLSVLFSACSGNGKKTTKNSSAEHHQIKPSGKSTPKEKVLQKISSGFEAKIRSIKAEQDRLDLFYDWTDVKTVNVWGIDGVGSATYYYSGTELKLIRFYPVEDLEASRSYQYYFKSGKLVLGQLTIQLNNRHSNAEHSAPGNTVAIGNIVSAEDRLFSKTIPIDYVLNCYFENDRIFHQELINEGMNNHDTSEIEKEKKRLKEEFRTLLKSV